VPVPSPSDLGEPSGTLLCCAFAEHGWKPGPKQILFLQPFGYCYVSLPPTTPGLVDRLREEIARVFTPPEGFPSRPVRVHNLGRLVRTSPLLRSTFYKVLRTCGGTVSNRVCHGRHGRLTCYAACSTSSYGPAIWGEGYGQFVPDWSIRAEGKGGKFGNRGDKSQEEVSRRILSGNGRPKRG